MEGLVHGPWRKSCCSHHSLRKQSPVLTEAVVPEGCLLLGSLESSLPDTHHLEVSCLLCTPGDDSGCALSPESAAMEAPKCCLSLLVCPSPGWNTVCGQGVRMAGSSPKQKRHITVAHLEEHPPREMTSSP